jgi:branched-chain amino acid transport system substrate-binding protein
LLKKPMHCRLAKMVECEEKFFRIERRKEMKKQVVKLIMTVMVALMILFSGLLSGSDAAEPIKIGAVLCKTGFAGFIGTPQSEAIEAVVHRVNREGGILGRPVELLIEDDQSTPSNAPVAATKLIRDKNVCAVIGSTLSAQCMPMLPVFERENVPNASLGAGPEITDPIKKWVFRIPLTDFRMAPFMLDYTKKRFNAKKIALLHSVDASAVMAAAGFREYAPKLGMELVAVEKFDPKDTNMIPQLTKVKTAQPEVILLYTSGASAIVIAKNYRQLQMKEPVVASHGCVSLEFLKQAPDYIHPTWAIFSPKGAVAEKLPPDDPYRKNVYEPFVRDLKEKFGPEKKFDAWGGVAHDGIRLVLEAIKGAGTDERSKVRDAMEKAEFKGFIADFKYSPTDHDGTAVINMVPVKIKDEAYWPAS